MFGSWRPICGVRWEKGIRDTLRYSPGGFATNTQERHGIPQGKSVNTGSAEGVEKSDEATPRSNDAPEWRHLLDDLHCKCERGGVK